MADQLHEFYWQFVCISRTRGYTYMKKLALAAVLTLVAVGPAFSGQYPPYDPDKKCHSCKKPTPMPEPSSIALLATGLLVAGGLVLIGRKRFVTE